MNYYNEIDKYAAQWLRNLIEARHIPNGEVDDRSISDVKPSELVGYTQCHFFAGIGGWSLALGLAGWPDDRPVWTGSCPCQPFSVAGQGHGVVDERHLWPHWFHLVRAQRPPVVFGEQVEAAVNHGWLDLVQDDLEGEGYAFAPVGIPAAGVGAPHIRQRLWFVADADGAGSLDGVNRAQGRGSEATTERGGADGMADSDGVQHQRESDIGPAGLFGTNVQSSECGNRPCDLRTTPSWLAHNNNPGLQGREPVRQRTTECTAGSDCVAGELGVPDSTGSQSGWQAPETPRYRSATEPAGQWDDGTVVHTSGEQVGVPGRAWGSRGADPWSRCDWLPCRDGKWRPVEPGTFPLAHGVSNRVGRLRAYGNAIVPQVAAQVIQAYMECRPC